MFTSGGDIQRTVTVGFTSQRLFYYFKKKKERRYSQSIFTLKLYFLALLENLKPHWLSFRHCCCCWIRGVVQSLGIRGKRLPMISFPAWLSQLTVRGSARNLTGISTRHKGSSLGILHPVQTPPSSTATSLPRYVHLTSGHRETLSLLTPQDG